MALCADLLVIEDNAKIGYSPARRSDPRLAEIFRTPNRFARVIEVAVDDQNTFARG